MSVGDLGTIVSKFFTDYKATTSLKLKCIDAYLTYCFFTGVIQVLLISMIHCNILDSLSTAVWSERFLSMHFLLALSLASLHLVSARTIKIILNSIEPNPTDLFLTIYLVLGVNLRLQLNPENKGQFAWTDERAFADFLFAHFVLHLVVMNFIG